MIIGFLSGFGASKAGIFIRLDSGHYYFRENGFLIVSDVNKRQVLRSVNKETGTKIKHKFI